MPQVLRHARWQRLWRAQEQLAPVLAEVRRSVALPLLQGRLQDSTAHGHVERSLSGREQQSLIRLLLGVHCR